MAKKPTPQDDNPLKGGPEHGSKMESDPPAEGGESVVKDPPDKPADPLAELRSELAEIRGELSGLRRAAPAQPEPKKEPAKPEPEPDWEELLFKNPKEAVQRIRADVRREIEAETGKLRSEYQGARSEEAFWDKFYSSHNDLREDDDLVRATLQRHMSELADMPVEKAASRLADLTRERILRYSGKQPPNGGGKRMHTEGANPPSPGKQAEEPPKVVTLSDLIRKRKERRAGGGKATAA